MKTEIKRFIESKTGTVNLRDDDGTIVARNDDGTIVVMQSPDGRIAKNWHAWRKALEKYLNDHKKDWSLSSYSAQ